MGAHEAFKQFCQTTSIKGLPRMIRAGDVCLRIMWAICVLFGSAVALYQIIYIMHAYFTYETSTSIEELEGADTIFPDVTVCKTNPPPILSAHTLESSQGLTFKGYLQEVEALMAASTKEENDTLEMLFSLEGYFRTVTDSYMGLHERDASDFTVECVFRYRNGEDVDCTTSKNTKPRFLTPAYPACISFKPANFADRSAIQPMSAIFYLDDFHPNLLVPNFGSDAEYPQTSGVALFTHAPNTFPNLMTGVSAAPGAETSVKVVDVRRLKENTPYSDCSGTTYEQLDTDADFSYTESSCRYKCIQRRAMHECHCLDPRAPTFTTQREEYAFCGALLLNNTNKRNNKSTSRKQDLLRELFCVYNNSDSRSDECDASCVEKCHSLSLEYHAMGAPWPHESRQLAFYNKYIKGRNYPPEFDIYELIQEQFPKNPKSSYEKLQRTSIISRNFVKVKVYFDGRTVVQYRDTPVHTPSSVSGSLGGILNLWIGISFVTAIEVAELVYNLVHGFMRGRDHQEDETQSTPEPQAGNSHI